MPVFANISGVSGRGSAAGRAAMLSSSCAGDTDTPGAQEAGVAAGGAGRSSAEGDGIAVAGVFIFSMLFA